MNQTSHYFGLICQDCFDTQFIEWDKPAPVQIGICSKCKSTTYVLYETTDKQEADEKNKAIKLWADKNLALTAK